MIATEHGMCIPYIYIYTHHYPNVISFYLISMATPSTQKKERKIIVTTYIMK